MAQTINQTEFDFLVELNAWVARGKSQGSYADEIGKSESNITYRLKEHRLKTERGVGLVDRDTGETFEERVDGGFYSLRAEQEAVTA